jgi:hypothetical protein
MKHVLLLLAFLLLAPSIAHADEPPRRQWYGYQLLLADGATGALTIAGAQSDSPGVIGGALFGSLFMGPIIHGLNGQQGNAVRSIGIRLAAPLLGSICFGAPLARVLSVNQSGNDRSDAQMAGVLTGAVLGWVIGVLVDDAMASKPVEPPRNTLRVTPIVSPTQIGVSGTF